MLGRAKGRFTVLAYAMIMLLAGLLSWDEPSVR